MRDVRLFRQDNHLSRGLYTDPAYDRDLTRAFIHLALEMGPNRFTSMTRKSSNHTPSSGS